MNSLRVWFGLLGIFILASANHASVFAFGSSKICISCDRCSPSPREWQPELTSAKSSKKQPEAKTSTGTKIEYYK